MNTVDSLNKPGFVPEFSSSQQVPYWLLEGAGFNVRAQIAKLLREYHSGIKSGKSPDQLVQTWLAQTKQDVVGFKIEYLQRGLVLPIPLAEEIINGKRRLVGGGYGHQVLLDTISEQERKGSVKFAVSRMEEFLLEAEEGSVAFMTSPPGWSGFKTDVSGQEISYEDTQTYVFKKNLDGSFEAVTVVTDMGVGENIAFLNQFDLLSQYADIKDEPESDLRRDKELLSQIVGNPVLLSGKGRERFFEDVVDKIREVKHNKEKIRIKTATGTVNKNFQDIYEGLNNRHKLLDLDPAVAHLLSEFNAYVGDISTVLSKNLGSIDLDSLTEDQLKDLVLTNPTLANIGKRLGDMILTIKMFTEGKVTDVASGLISVATFNQEAKDLALIPGCNGGGLQTIATTFSGRSVSLVSSEAYQDLPAWRKNKKDPDYCIHCGACGEAIEQVVRKGEHCPAKPRSCGAKREC